MARTARVNIMTDEKVKEKLEYLAGRMGMTVSALGSYIIGNFVYQQEEIFGGLMDVGKEIIKRSAEKNS